MSDDGRNAVVVIALLGNPFSPNYSRARRHGPADALAFCAMNVVLYSRVASAWALDECRVARHDRAADGVAIGASSMRWEGDRLTVEINERTSAFRRPLRGRIVFHPETRTGLELPIDDEGAHQWWPAAPLGRVEVDLPQPGFRFTGHGYYDGNAGDVPLESTFETWNWSRARLDDGALLTYDVACSSGAGRSHAFRVSPHGTVEHLPHLAKTRLRRTVWALERHTHVEGEHPGRIVRTLEDGPFYARALVETRVGGRPVIAMHETLAAHRLRRDWVRAVSGVRMRTAP